MMLLYTAIGLFPYSSTKIHLSHASLAQSLQEDNSEDDTFHVQACGFRVKNYQREFFTRKNAPVSPSELCKRSGLSKRSDLRRIGQNKKTVVGGVLPIQDVPMSSAII